MNSVVTLLLRILLKGDSSASDSKNDDKVVNIETYADGISGSLRW